MVIPMVEWVLGPGPGVNASLVSFNWTLTPSPAADDIQWNSSALTIPADSLLGGTNYTVSLQGETWALIQYKDVILPVQEIPLWR